MVVGELAAIPILHPVITAIMVIAAADMEGTAVVTLAVAVDMVDTSPAQ